MSRRLSISRLLALLALFLFTSLPTKGSPSNTTVGLFRPVSPVEYRPMAGAIAADADVDGAPFQLCLQCRCCAAADPNDCSSMSCCFGIDCDLPDKPYGVCAFVPKVCNCTSCT